MKKKFTDKPISVVVKEFAAEFKTFVLTTVEKYQQFSHMGPWCATLMTLENLHFAKRTKKTLDKWKRPLFLLNIFKIFFIYMFVNAVNFSVVCLEYI